VAMSVLLISRQSSSLARHRRIHTGKRPYKCAHDGCLKRFVAFRSLPSSILTLLSFCRKTTMVKHQRRSHQRGIHSSELDDGDTSDSDSGESPSTPQHPGQMQWPQTLNVSSHVMPHGHQIHRAHSFADFGQHIDSFPVQYGHRHTLSGGAHNFHHPIQEQHAPPPHMMHRAPSLPAHSSYYVPEQNNPGVATLNTNPTPIQTYQIPRQSMERHSQEIMQSSPSAYSSASRGSPVSQDSYYTHHPAQAATYALHNSSPVEQQPIIQYQQQMPHHLTQQPQPLQSHTPPVHENYHPAQQDGQWYDHVAYQPPVVEVIHQIQTYPQTHVFHDPWVQKMEAFDDPSLQMPSARIENL
jgi:hypothetical protein